MSQLMPWKQEFYFSLSNYGECPKELIFREQVIPADASTEEIDEVLNKVLRMLTGQMLATIRVEYSTSLGILRALFDQKDVNPELYCVCLVVNGRLQEALEFAFIYSKGRGAESASWQVFKPKFDQWFRNGAGVPSNTAARKFLFDRVEQCGGSS